MKIHIRPRAGGLPLDLAAPRLPGSKSHSQRAMVLAAMSPGEWHLRGALRSDDIDTLAEALRRLGAGLQWHGDELRVRGRAPGRLDAKVQLHDNGTALRVLLMLVPLLGGRLRVDGSERLRQRPIDAALQALRPLGVAVVGEHLPCAVDGRELAALPTAIDASVTTQAASGAMLALALRGGGAGLRLLRPQAGNYLALTAHVLRQFGFAATLQRDGLDLVFAVHGGPRAAAAIDLPPDPSARAFPLALAALHGRDASDLLPRADDDPHPDWDVDHDLVRLRQPGDIELLDLAARPDCVPALAAVAAGRRGTTQLRRLPALRHKESDRLQAMAAGLAAAGVAAWVEGDDLTVRGPLPEGTDAVVLPAPADHRVVMALALLGTKRQGGVVVPHGEAVAKSWPGFFGWLGRCAQVDAID